MPSPEQTETQQNKGSQQLPATELNRIIHEGPQVDTPARAPVSSDLERSDDLPLSQLVKSSTARAPVSSDLERSHDLPLSKLVKNSTARAPVSSDLERFDDLPLSKLVKNSTDTVDSNPSRQNISSNAQDDANAQDNWQDLENLPKYLYPLMNVTDFKKRYEADDIHLARAAMRQDRHVKVCC